MNYQNYTITKVIPKKETEPSWKYSVGTWLLELAEFMVAAWILLAAGQIIFGLTSRLILSIN
jgi:hypothetical protein